VWARPIYADQPLWNADQVRGKIVAVMRGPRPPAPVVGYNVKIYYCQRAGAVGIVFVDYEDNFSRVPMCADLPIFPGGPMVKVL